MAQVEQKRAFNKLKHDLEPWRNLIVQCNSVLTWEKNYYPAVVGGGITLLYITLWAMDLTNVTMIALLALFLVLFDFVYPSLSRFLFNPDNWSGKQEAEFERVVCQMVSLKTLSSDWYGYIFNNKERKSTMFVISTSIALLSLAWIGAIINNMLLMYLLTLFVVMYPGMQDKVTISSIKEKIDSTLGPKVGQMVREMKNQKCD